MKKLCDLSKRAIVTLFMVCRGFTGGASDKNLPANATDVRDVGLISGWGRFPGERHGNSLQYSCLENPVERGAWWVIVYGVTKSQTRLK